MKSNCKRPRPLLGLPNWTFPLFLSCRKQPLKSLIIINKHFNDFNETAHCAICANGLKPGSKTLDVKLGRVCIRYKDHRFPSVGFRRRMRMTIKIMIGRGIHG